MALVATAAVLVGAAALLLPGGRVAPGRSVAAAQGTSAIPRSDWGRVQYYNGLIVFTLAPAGDRRRKRELTFASVPFTAAGLAIGGSTAKTTMIEGEPMGVCGYHFQGSGLNAIVTSGSCVPSWARTTSGRPARLWLRVENLVPTARIVVLAYQPQRQRLTLLPWVA